jgi:molybdopterin-binding protein
MRMIPVGEAASALGVSIDTLRRWERDGRLQTERGPGNRRIVSEAEVRRLGGRLPTRVGKGTSIRNRFEGVITNVEVSGVVGLVEVQAGEHRVVGVITRDAIEELGLAPGVPAAAMVKATNVMVERL